MDRTNATDPPEKEVEVVEYGQTNLLALRSRMATEKRRSIEYLDTRRMEETPP